MPTFDINLIFSHLFIIISDISLSVFIATISVSLPCSSQKGSMGGHTHQSAHYIIYTIVLTPSVFKFTREVKRLTVIEKSIRTYKSNVFLAIRVLIFEEVFDIYKFSLY